ncbi:hypothetical protein Unana1_08743 [Umbelopsis nana]
MAMLFGFWPLFGQCEGTYDTLSFTFSSLARYNNPMRLTCIDFHGNGIFRVLLENPVNNNLHYKLTTDKCYTVYVENVGKCGWDGHTIQYLYNQDTQKTQGFVYDHDFKIYDRYPDLPPEKARPQSSNGWREDPPLRCPDPKGHVDCMSSSTLYTEQQIVL